MKRLLIIILGIIVLTGCKAKPIGRNNTEVTDSGIYDISNEGCIVQKDGNTYINVNLEINNEKKRIFAVYTTDCPNYDRPEEYNENIGDGLAVMMNDNITRTGLLYPVLLTYDDMEQLNGYLTSFKYEDRKYPGDSVLLFDKDYNTDMRIRRYIELTAGQIRVLADYGVKCELVGNKEHRGDGYVLKDEDGNLHNIDGALKVKMALNKQNKEYKYKVWLRTDILEGWSGYYWYKDILDIMPDEITNKDGYIIYDSIHYILDQCHEFYIELTYDQIVFFAENGANCTLLGRYGYHEQQSAISTIEELELYCDNMGDIVALKRD